MLTRRTLIKLPALGALAFYLPDAWPAADLRRRAVIVGIDKYQAPHSSDGTPTASPSASASSSASGRIKRGERFHDLDGAVNDAALMYQILVDRFGFKAEDIVFLQNEKASRDQILQAFKSHLVDDASAGDVSLFYYAGHGSTVLNTGSEAVDQLDETLVPADSYKGAYDIRDKEMVRLYRAALNKKVVLTIILDSCHSGGMSRGVWNAAGKTRVIPPDPSVSVNDPPDRDPVTGKKLPDPANMGMLFLAAARADQTAGETTVTMPDAKGVPQDIPHGAFTAALSTVLSSSIANQSVEQICERVQAIMASQGSMQVPICAGSDRTSRGLLGQPAGSADALLVPVESVDGSSVRLRGGSAIGLAPGCILARSDGQKIKLELTSVELGVSDAKIVGSAPASGIHPGDLFKLETWVASEDVSIKMFYAKDGPSADAVLAVARSIEQLAGHNGLQTISDLTDKIQPTHVVYWKDGAYHLVGYPATGQPVSLGAAPTTAEIQKALGTAANVRLWPILPPDRQFAASLKLGAGTDNAAIHVVNSSADCLYLLAGRLHGDSVEYSWVFKDMFVADRAKARLPLQSDWTSSAEQLTSLATRLGRVYAWLNLNGPAGGDHSFPYTLSFEKTGKSGAASTETFKFGDQYKFVFVADAAALQLAATTGGVAKRYVYVFLIDSSGNATCFFPDPKYGNDNNLLPRTDPPTATIVATRLPNDIDISPPAGTDNYFMIASEQPLDPSIFQWTGVRAPANTRDAGNPLQFLFASVGEQGTRGAQKAPSVPATWSIQSMAVHSGP